MQAARLHLPVGRDLRRLPVHVRLRTARGQPAAQRQERLVGGHGAAAGRRGGPRRRHPVPAGGVGGLRPPVQLHRPVGGLPEVPPTLASGQDRRGVPQLRLDGVHRGTRLQPDVQDPRRAAGGRRGGGLPAAGDGPGHVHQLRQRAPDHPQEATLRHRPGGEVVPQRDHPPELRLPHPRVRADGDGVLRAARARPTAGSPTGWTSGSAGTPTWACLPTSCGCATTTPTSCPTTRPPPPTSSSASRGAGTSSRASPTAPTSISRPTPRRRGSDSSTSTSPPASATSPMSSNRRPGPPGP